MHSGRYESMSHCLSHPGYTLYIQTERYESMSNCLNCTGYTPYIPTGMSEQVFHCLSWPGYTLYMHRGRYESMSHYSSLTVYTHYIHTRMSESMSHCLKHPGYILYTHTQGRLIRRPSILTILDIPFIHRDVWFDVSLPQSASCTLNKQTGMSVSVSHCLKRPGYILYIHTWTSVSTYHSLNHPGYNLYTQGRLFWCPTVSAILDIPFRDFWFNVPLSHPASCTLTIETGTSFSVSHGLNWPGYTHYIPTGTFD